MSYTNAQVGNAITRTDKSKTNGGNMSCHKSAMPDDGNFAFLNAGYSYSTVVVRSVFNTYSRKCELWVTPQYFSVSTTQHIRSFISGFKNNHPHCRVFVTWAGGNAGGNSGRGKTFYHACNTRATADLALDTIATLQQALKVADEPRKRDATRRGVVLACMAKLVLARGNFCDDMPAQYIKDNAKTLAELDTLRHFLDMLNDTLDIAELRSSVRGYLALNDIS